MKAPVGPLSQSDLDSKSGVQAIAPASTRHFLKQRARDVGARRLAPTVTITHLFIDERVAVASIELANR
jgi:hypothetical protein